MTTKKEDKALAVPNGGGYLSPAEGSIPITPEDLLRDNLGGGTITPLDLPRITIPAGGGTMWMVPTLDGVEPRKELVGVVAHWKDMRAYWSTTIEEGGGGQPPDCSSTDGLVGVGTPGGQCVKCPLNAFGSARGGSGRGKACREARSLFMLIGEDALLPVRVPLPPMSIGPCRQFFLTLAANRLPYWQVEIAVGLEQSRTQSGITYSRATFRVNRRLSPDEVARVGTYRDSLKPVLDGYVVTADDVPME